MEDYREIEQELFRILNSPEFESSAITHSGSYLYDTMESNLTSILENTVQRSEDEWHTQLSDEGKLSYVKIKDERSFKFIFERATKTTQIEIPARPGDITLISYAKNLRLSTFLTLYQKLRHFNEVIILVNNTGTKYEEWRARIDSLKHLPEPHLWWTGGEEEHESDIREWISQEINSEGIVSFPKLDAFPSTENDTIDSTDTSVLQLFPGDLHVLENNQDEQTQGQESRALEMQVINPTVASWEDVFTPTQYDVEGVRLHYRFTNPLLQQIHRQCSIPIVYTDTLLNLINQFCIEFGFLVSEANKIDEISTNDISDFKKAYIMLYVYAMCKQPPFVLLGSQDTTPVLHLRFFLSQIVTHNNRVMNMPINLPLIRNGDPFTLNTYSAMIEGLFKARDDLCKEQGISIGSAPRRPARGRMSNSSSQEFRY